jgi:hypothetical protein
MLSRSRVSRIASTQPSWYLPAFAFEDVAAALHFLSEGGGFGFVEFYFG